MPFIPHTQAEVAAMLESIGATSCEELFQEIPDALKIKGIDGLGPGLTEMQAWRLMQTLAAQDQSKLNFIGAGCYEHYIPAAVWELATRGEFLTAYTPYQPEASQGTLQVLYEYQSMLAALTAMDVANASLYEGATALSEAILMAIRCTKRASNKRILLPKSVHPFYRQVVKTMTSPQAVELIEVEFDHNGQISKQKLDELAKQEFIALVIPQPNFLGILEDVDFLCDWAHQNGALVIATVNPLAMALLKPPGEWGTNGADFACGEGQSLGVPLASGGPYIGFLCCKREYIRQLPGRIAGVTTDLDGKRGFVLTLQAREQHIRRAKATSNICTNESLLATVNTIYLALMGAKGLKQVAVQCHNNTSYLKEALRTMSKFRLKFDSPFFHELVLEFQKPVAEVLEHLAQQKIQGGFDLSIYYPELGNCVLCCVTETKSKQDLEQFIQALEKC